MSLLCWIVSIHTLIKISNITCIAHLQHVVFQAPEMSSSSDGLAGMPFGGPSASDKLELARKLAQRINLQHNIGKEAKGASQQAAEFILKGGAAMQPTISAKTVAEQVLCMAFT